MRNRMLLAVLLSVCLAQMAHAQDVTLTIEGAAALIGSEVHPHVTGPQPSPLPGLRRFHQAPESYALFPHYFCPARFEFSTASFPQRYLHILYGSVANADSAPGIAMLRLFLVGREEMNQLSDGNKRALVEGLHAELLAAAPPATGIQQPDVNLLLSEGVGRWESRESSYLAADGLIYSLRYIPAKTLEIWIMTPAFYADYAAVKARRAGG